MNFGLKTLMALAIASTMGAGLVSLTLPARSQATADIVRVDVNVVAKGYRTSKLTGQSVVNEKNERVGTIDDFVIGRDRSLFTVLQVGGFLGIGSKLVAVPFQSLTLDDRGEKITLPGASMEQLERLAEFKYL
jgi:hypothetical protein